jgi:CxxC motif-containing protein (DUF1111 family)
MGWRAVLAILLLAGALEAPNELAAAPAEPEAASATEPAPAPPPRRRLDAAIGRKLFARAWVPAPSSTLSNDGLGPLFNAPSCASCHRGLDRMPLLVDQSGLVTSDARVLRLSDAAGRGDPVYGHQLQTAAVPGQEAEGRLKMTEAGAEPILLSFGPFAAGTRVGLRDAPSLRGVALLERVPDAAIHALAAAAKPHGIGGRVNERANGQVGRFGWKASAVSIAEQTGVAFSLDLGMGTPTHASPGGDCTPRQSACRAGPHGGTEEAPEIGPEIVALLTDYLASVPAPEARDDAAGAAIFASTGCSSCHTPSLPLAGGGEAQAFTDLLLHDMGQRLDGGATEPGVAPTEWRTAPLWGVARTLAAGAGLLHDGRASSVEEAVRWHGGEASAVVMRFSALPPEDRQRLLNYVATR